MDLGAEGTYVEVLVNNTHFQTAFCDSGALLFAAVSEQLVDRLSLKRIPITRRKLSQFAKTEDTVWLDSLASFQLDIDGTTSDVVAYVVPNHHFGITLGKGWMEKHDVVLEPARNQITIRKPNLVVISTKTRAADPTFTGISANSIRAITYRARRTGRIKEVQIFSASLADIQKALQRKVYSNPADKAPEWLKDVLFAFNRDDANKLPPHRGDLDHKIDLEDGKHPPNMPLYEMSKEQLLVLRKTLIELMDSGFIRASSSSAGAPVIFVKKPGGGLRFCVDYRGLNAISKKDNYPLPLIGETLKLIASAKWVSNVDVISAFHRVRVREGDEPKTAFKTRLGSYEWLVTPFGLTGAPATFQRYINSVLCAELDICCSAYLDDVVIFSNGTRQEHRELVRRIVGKLGKAGLQLDIDKCCFEASSIKYLGYIINVGKG